jgi:Fusaric acid resistance protein family
VLPTALNSLLASLASWRAVSVRLARQSNDAARQEAHAILDDITPELRSVLGSGMPRRWMADPGGLREIARAAIETLRSDPTGAPSLRLLADQTAKVLAGAADALDALAPLIDIDTRADRRPRGVRPHVPDWLPAYVNAGRAFVTIAAVAVFWIITAWPNGAVAITLAAIVVIIFAARGDQAAAISVMYMAGVAVACVFAAIIKFAVLPGVETFAAFSIVIGLYLVPVGALISPERQPATLTAMGMGGSAYFLLLLAPANQMDYDTTQFYNTALAVLAGCGAATLSFRLLPPLSPAFRTRRLLALTLRDMRRLATGRLPRMPDDWEGLIYGRLTVLPDDARPLQRAQLIAGLFIGTEIIRLRRIAPRLGLDADLAAALAALAQDNATTAIAQLALVDRRLTLLTDQEAPAPLGSGRAPACLRFPMRLPSTSLTSTEERLHEICRNQSVRRLCCAVVADVGCGLVCHHWTAPNWAPFWPF